MQNFFSRMQIEQNHFYIHEQISMLFGKHILKKHLYWIQRTQELNYDLK